MVLQDATRYYEWYDESLRGTASGTRRYCEVLPVVLQITMWYYEKSKVQRVLFLGILQKIVFQKKTKKRYEKFYKIHGKPTVIESLY